MSEAKEVGPPVTLWCIWDREEDSFAAEVTTRRASEHAARISNQECGRERYEARLMAIDYPSAKALADAVMAHLDFFGSDHDPCLCEICDARESLLHEAKRVIAAGEYGEGHD